jgi:hypothetical protein
MRRAEWTSIYGLLCVGCGKTLLPEAIEVYFDLLEDLPYPAMVQAAKAVLIEHPWATFPSIAELRAAGVDAANGSIAKITAGEAWQLAWSAAMKIDPEVEGAMQRHTAGMPPLVLRAMKAMGIIALCGGNEPVSVLRAQFVKIFEALAERERRIELLPPKVAAAIAGKPAEKVGAERRPSLVNNLARSIGVIPGED